MFYYNVSINKGQAVWFGLAWLPVVCEKLRLHMLRKTFLWLMHQLTFEMFQFVFKSIAITLAFEVRDFLHI